MYAHSTTISIIVSFYYQSKEMYTNKTNVRKIQADNNFIMSKVLHLKYFKKLNIPEKQQIQ